MKTLLDTPSDPDANLLVGKYLCFVQRDWEQGLPLLAKGADAALKAMAEKELAHTAEAAAQMSLADGWWDMAEKEAAQQPKAAMERRAKYWYAKALPSLAGLTKAKAEKRLTTVAETLPEVTAPAVSAPADASAGKAQQLFSAVLKETAPLAAQNGFAEAIALLERKARDPALSEAAELLKQEKADLEAVAELRRQAFEALRKMVGKEVTLKKGTGVIKDTVLDDGKRDGITLSMGGPQMVVRADQLHADDVDQYAPREFPSPQRGEGGASAPGEGARQRGLLYLYAGNLPKAKEYFGKAREAYDALDPKPQTLNPKP